MRARAGVPALPLYSLRHATASILLAAGVPVAVAVAAKMLTKDAAQKVDSFWEGRTASRFDARTRGEGTPDRPMSANVSAKSGRAP